MKRHFYLAGGCTAFALGSIGIFLPLLPTVPFMILAAFCFARSSPRLEQWMLEHRIYGTHIRNWRYHGAVSRRGKKAAIAAFAFSVIVALFLVAFPWSMISVLAAVIGGWWIWTRPEVPLPKADGPKADGPKGDGPEAENPPPTPSDMYKD